MIVINLKNSPSYPTDEGLNAFFDLGGWMGFALSDDKTKTGFAGPYILGLEHGVWASNNFASLDIISENGNSLLTNLNYSEQNYFPGRLEQKLHFEDIELISNLIFTSDKSEPYEDEIPNEYLSNLNFTYASIAKECENIKENTFVKNYEEDYGIIPNKYAVRGFDVTYDLLLRLAMAEDLYEALELKGSTEYVENKFDYHKKMIGGYYNFRQEPVPDSGT